MLGVNLQGNPTEKILKIANRILEGVSTTVMTLTGYLTSFLLSFTLSRVILNVVLVPLYLYKLTLSMIPHIIKNAFKLLYPGGWSRLVGEAETYRARSDSLAMSQLDGTYQFTEDELFHVDRDCRGWMETLPWANDTHEFNVCGATVRYVHLRPSYSNILQDGKKNHKQIVFLHGNPSWSYMWRNVFPPLLERGHEVYAIDWLGHGRSDKILKPEAITFELHIRTLIEFFQVTSLENAIVAAHDWGGCIALCTIPLLHSSACDNLFLLNTFFPPRLSDASLHYRLLNRAWYCTTGLLGGYLPESAVMRFISPQLSPADVNAYSSPYTGLPRSSKSSIKRFSHIAPSLPRSILFHLRQTWPWKLLEGLCGPSHFNTVTTQARLSAQDDQVRRFWGARDSENKHSPSQGVEIVVVFGDKDPLVRDYKHVLVKSINPELMVSWAPRGLWIHDAGHMPVEEKAGDIAQFIARFARPD
ncbi:Alpha/Beta hydrolase protein [Aspergillus cavernicola]|uniref:Alpha/Beta hydrolase protein n=1 Tax=Aspergillus cavernicola TaxID=176166 RepID=A0ABR4HI90_9EURO